MDALRKLFRASKGAPLADPVLTDTTGALYKRTSNARQVLAQTAAQLCGCWVVDSADTGLPVLCGRLGDHQRSRSLLAAVTPVLAAAVKDREPDDPEAYVVAYSTAISLSLGGPDEDRLLDVYAVLTADGVDWCSTGRYYPRKPALDLYAEAVCEDGGFGVRALYSHAMELGKRYRALNSEFAN